MTDAVLLKQTGEGLGTFTPIKDGLTVSKLLNSTRPKSETQAVVSKDLSKTYGRTQALDKVSIHVAPGSFYGLLGPNGAGKSTLMKLMVGVLAPSGGSIEVFGHKAGKGDEVRTMVGYVPQDVALYGSLTGKQNLEFFGSMYGLRGRPLQQSIDEILEFIGLTEKAGEAVKSYSGGMKRRLNIAAALLHKPRLLLLDEPTVGVDPHSRQRMFEMLKHLQAQGATIVYSSHYMEEVEELCDTVGIIDHGQLVDQDPLPELLARYAGQEVYLEISPDGTVPPDIPAWLASCSTRLRSVRPLGSGWLAEAENRADLMADILAAARQKALIFRRLELVKPSLESVFLKLTGTSLRDQ
ncbi:Putative ABC transporter [Acididesulfobacillus acetoxydans]|uniref:ABC transporter n=1 Tax=Acididesulfobacillus acetoxydans TaxID=1561005 RepID=A0A8S0XCN9_9FIRM|nr:ABC transporter ATP-binding protein [Acididesulfobacillus acetoxydans]CAA7602686.1 Putative ABC transporter [Acididesulfobacillus acetoxydans]CEJ06457.1 Nod factor export ATP-binding protein I [Acididesulfobacillus acetoxydans]